MSESGGGVLEEEWRRGRRPPGSGGRWRGTRAQRSRVALRMPQVVVRITGKSRGRAGVWGRVWYISHEGELALEREDGTTVQGRAELERLVEDWSAHFRSRANGRDTVQLSFSVPESEVNRSPEARARVLAAVRATARAEWGPTHPYVLGSHTNSDNFHVHVIVRSRGYGGEIVPTQKADLERWRVRFAAAAREQGLWVDASPRPARGQTARSVPTSVHRKQERGEALRPGPVPSASEAAAWEQALRKRNASERREYVERARETVRAAAAEPEASERKTLLDLAVELGQYAVDLPFDAPRSERERAPVQCVVQRAGRAEVASAVALLAGAGGVAVSSDPHGWVSAEEAAERSQTWRGESALELRFSAARREHASAQAQGRELVGLATAALRRVGVTSEYSLRAEVSEDRVQVHAVVNDPSGDLGRAAPVLEERFGEWAAARGYEVERFERRPGLSRLKGALRELRREVLEEARTLPAAERRELVAAADAMAESVFGRSEEAEPEL